MGRDGDGWPVDAEDRRRMHSGEIPINPRHSMYAIYAYIDPRNHPNVGIYGSPMECLAIVAVVK